jgi:hypothetical protein
VNKALPVDLELGALWDLAYGITKLLLAKGLLGENVLLWQHRCFMKLVKRFSAFTRSQPSLSWLPKEFKA